MGFDRPRFLRYPVTMAPGNATTALTPEQAALFDFKLYRYEPSLPAAAVSLAVFAILTALHALKILRHRSLYFIPFAVGGLCKSFHPDVTHVQGEPAHALRLGTPPTWRLLTGDAPQFKQSATAAASGRTSTLCPSAASSSKLSSS